MDTPIHIIYNFLNSYNLSTTKLHLALAPNGQVHLCTGVLRHPPYKKHQKEIKKKFAESLVEKDFRFCNCRLEFQGDKFIVGNANISVDNILAESNSGIYQYNNVYEDSRS